METILTVLNVVLAIVLVLIILLQRSEGGALGLGLSQENFASTIQNYLEYITVDYLKYPIETLKIGSFGTNNMLEMALDKNATILVASTSEIFEKSDVLLKRPSLFILFITSSGICLIYEFPLFKDSILDLSISNPTTLISLSQKAFDSGSPT